MRRGSFCQLVMRMFAVKDLFATLSCALITVVAIAMPVAAQDKPSVPAPAQAEKRASAKTAKAEVVDERDFYTRRAQEMLDADNLGVDSKPHPLTKDFPEQFVVVCTGGCKNRQAYIVDMEPRSAQRTIEIGEMIPTAAGGPGVSTVVCIGGCPDANSVHFTSSNVGDFINDWESAHRAPASRSKSESGRWLTDQN